MFRTQFDRIRTQSNVGNPIKPYRAGKLDAKKNVKVETKGSTNLYAYINSFADSVDIHVLLSRFANGDKEALIQRAASFIDISELPNNINDFIELYKNGQSLFSGLPKEIKEKFNNNADQFIGSIGSPEWLDIMKASPSDIKEEKLENLAATKETFDKAAKVQFESTPFGNDVVEEVRKESVKNAL